MKLLKTVGLIFLWLLIPVLLIRGLEYIVATTIPPGGAPASDALGAGLVTGVGAFIILAPFFYLINITIRNYRRSKLNDSFYNATSKQKDTAKKINNYYIEIIKNFQNENGSFCQPENWIDLYSVFFWVNISQLKEQGMDILVLGALREYLLLKKNSNYSINKVMESSYSLRKQLTKQYTLETEKNQTRFAEYITTRLYGIKQPQLIPIVWNYIGLVLSFTEQTLARDKADDEMPKQPQIDAISITKNTIAISDSERTNSQADNSLSQFAQSEQKNAKHKEKPKKFCKYCGAEINADTKKCTGCGKQYFHLPKLHKHTVIIAIVMILVISLTGLNIYQYINNKNEQIILQQNISSLKDSIGIKDTQIENQINTIERMSSEYYFYHYYAVIVQRGVTNYHRYGCSRIDYSYFWIYNREAAIAKGYDPCPVCCE